MIVTVTPNTGIDHVVFVDELRKGSTFRAADSAIGMAGKPTDASYVLGELGIPSLALGFAAGDVGRIAESLLRGKGVTPAFVEVHGRSRLNTVLIDRDDGSATTITTATLRVDAAQRAALIAAFEAALLTADAVVLGGTLPDGTAPDLFAELITLARDAGIPTIFDAAEPALSVGLAARPDFIKPNRHELAGLVGRPIASIADARAAGADIVSRFGVSVVATLDQAGAVAVLPDRCWFIPPLPINVVSAAGAGDAVLAGLAAALAQRRPIEDGLRLGFAAAAAVCLTAATADCRRADVERLLPLVTLQPVS
jgi:1-phosphofructokinase family hexose kinase